MKRIRQNRERGTALVEFAVVLPLLLYLSMMAIEGGAMIRTHIVLNNAAREGARYAIVREPDIASVKQVVIDYAAQSGVTLTADEINVDPTLTVPGPNALIPATKVTVSHPYTLYALPAIPGSTAAGTRTLFGSAEFRNFWP